MSRKMMAPLLSFLFSSTWEPEVPSWINSFSISLGTLIVAAETELLKLVKNAIMAKQIQTQDLKNAGLIANCPGVVIMWSIEVNNAIMGFRTRTNHVQLAPLTVSFLIVVTEF